jgi:hypothetical protein
LGYSKKELRSLSEHSFGELLPLREEYQDRISEIEISGILGPLGDHRIRVNASRLSHAELEVSETLDEGDPADLANRLRRLQAILPNLKVLGGCCGTDHHHIRAIGEACLARV